MQVRDAGRWWVWVVAAALLACGGDGPVKADSGGSEAAPPAAVDTDTDADADADTDADADADSDADSDSDTDTDPTTAPDGLALCINEFLADNAGSFDQDGERPDWIELHNPGPDPVDLRGWWLSDDRADPTKHAVTGSIVVEPGGFVLFFADEDPDAGPHHLDFRLSAEGEDVVLRDPWGHTSVVAYGEVGPDVAAARETDCCAGPCWEFPLGGTPGGTNDVPDPPVRVEDRVVERGATWRWATGEDGPPAEWVDPGFPDGAWSSGAAPLGYGDGHIVTVLPSGPDPSAKWPAAYFRYTFDATDLAQVDGLEVTLMRDDGAVVWLNGTELFRAGMPEGPITHETWADVTMGGGDETAFFAWSPDPAALVDGENVVAVEVHQANGSSSDLGFDLTMTIERLVPAD